MLEGAAFDELHHRLPLAVVAVDEPVDQLVDVAFDGAAGVGEDAALELAAQLLTVHQLDNARDAQVLVEEAVAAFGHLVEDVVDAVALVAEVAAHVILVGSQLLVDGVERLEVAFEQVLALRDDILVASDQGGGDADRVGELQPHAFAGVEEVEDVLFERAEAAALPVFGAGPVLFTFFGFEGEAGADGEGGGRDAEQLVRVLLHKVEHLLLLGFGGEKLDLVDDDHDLLPQSRICCRKARSDSLKGRSALVTKRTRSLRGTKCSVNSWCWRMTALVPGVSTRLTSCSQGTGRPRTGHAAVGAGMRGGFAMADEDQLAGGGHDAFGQVVAAEEGVDDGALAGG